MNGFHTSHNTTAVVITQPWMFADLQPTLYVPGMEETEKNWETLWGRVKWAREKAVLTQRALADLAGLSQQSISKLENPEKTPYEPKASTIDAIASICNVNAHWLLTGNGSPTEKRQQNETKTQGQQRQYPEDLTPIFDAITDAWKTSSLPEPLLKSFEQLFRSLPAGAAQEPITSGSAEDDELTKRAVKNLSKRIKNQTGMPDPDKNGKNENN